MLPKRTLLVLFTILALVLIACGPQPTTAPAQSTTAPTAVTQPTSAPTSAPGAVTQPTTVAATTKKRLTVGLKELVTQFDYPYDWAIVATWIQSNIGDCAIWRDRKTGEFVPWLAESFKNIDDTTWSITLKKGIKFHNGEPLNAAAVKYTVDRILADPKALVYNQWTFIKEIKVKDDYNFDVITVAKEPAFLSKMAGTACQVVPPKYMEEQKSEGFNKKPVGTGPFKFVEFVKDSRIVLEANPDYFLGKPAIDEIVFRSIPEDSTRVAELLTGGIDLTVAIPLQDWKRVEADNKLTLDRFLTTQTMMLVARAGPSKTQPDFKGVTTNPKVRQAIELAIDRKALLDLIGGMGIPTRTRITPPTIGSNANYYNNVGTYDPAKAKALLQEAGYKGETLTMHSTTAWLMQKEVSEALAAMLQNVGLKVDLKLLPITAFREQVYVPNKNEELYIDALGNSFFDPWIAVLSERSDRRERTGWSGPAADEADKLIRAGAENMNLAERIKQYERIQELWTAADGGPYVFLYQARDVIGRSKKINFDVPTDGFLWFGKSAVAQ